MDLGAELRALLPIMMGRWILDGTNIKTELLVQRAMTFVEKRVRVCERYTSGLLYV